MAPLVPRTRAAAAIRMKQIALDNHSRMIQRLRAKLETERRFGTIIREELEKKIVSMDRELELMMKDNCGLHDSLRIYQDREKTLHEDFGRRITQLEELRRNHHARIQEIKGTVQEQALTIDALTDENTSLLQAIQDLQGVGAIPFEDEPEEYPEGDPEDLN
ncbi:hypothetical protein F511_22288 [Dorcoceras hygrometricum]|uniref:Uncharacterized protein n=1 Tax=Dorcoceras hygrometricum TaxID=472368 RepID=A0A2Z7DIL3_9LAMI|nr:hypothetical protein F511_22288 [Dorcoceras hygrometricum]